MAVVPAEDRVAQLGLDAALLEHEPTIAAMRFGAALWLNRTSWPEVRDAALAAEAAGWDAVYVDDHLLTDEGEWTGARFEGWSILSSLAPLTNRVRLGLLVGANTFRNPGLTAKLAATLDHLSAGRAILGIGAGWFEREHSAFGIPFGSSAGRRLDQLDEATGIIRRLLDGERFDHAGAFYSMRDALIAARPIQSRLPILIGGSGPRKTLRTTARYADIWNGYGDPATIAHTSSLLEERCAEVGRRYADIERSVTLDIVIRDDLRTAQVAYAHQLAHHGMEPDVGTNDPELGLAVGGSPERVADYVRRYAELGLSEVIFVFRAPFDWPTIERLPEVRAAEDPHRG